jgi:hypothetical protein
LQPYFTADPRLYVHWAKGDIPLVGISIDDTPCYLCTSIGKDITLLHFLQAGHIRGAVKESDQVDIMAPNKAGWL